jgi:protocatechuate 3,4-dioxygenase beta subunit
MERKNFLKGVGLAAVGLTVASAKSAAKIIDPGDSEKAGSCVLIPTEIAGPFPLDLSTNRFFFRKDVREGKRGVRVNLKLKIVGTDNCGPMQNVRVNIWQCDKDGNYSGYSAFNNVGSTFMRGYQITDVNGIVNFTTVLPGWYPGRVCHIHVQIFVSTSYAVVSQFTFPAAVKNSIYLANPALYPKGADPLRVSQDMAFSDDFSHQRATLTRNANTALGYDSYLEIAVRGRGTMGKGHIERQNEKQFTLKQNYPNPYMAETKIPFTLINDSDVKIGIWDLTGRNVATILDTHVEAGDHEVIFNPNSINLPIENYIYQFEVSNSEGVFKDGKMMTISK